MMVEGNRELTVVLLMLVIDMKEENRDQEMAVIQHELIYLVLLFG